MTTVVLCSVLKTGTLFFKVTLKSNIFLSYIIVSSNNDKGLVKFTAVCLGRELFDSRPMYWSTLSHVGETMCIMLVARTCVCCDRIIGIEKKELVVTYVLENKL